MAAPRKYGEELREQATRMAVDARKEPATRSGAISRIAEQLGMHPETLRGWALDALDMGLWLGSEPARTSPGSRIIRTAACRAYRAIRYTERLAEAEAVASVGSKGDSYDNAMAEAFNSLFKANASATR